MSQRSPDYRTILHIPVTLAMKTQLELEAWECQLSLAAYLRGLLSRRGKWQRTVGRSGGYDIAAEIPRVRE